MSEPPAASNDADAAAAAAALSVLRAVARRAAIGDRLEAPAGEGVLLSVVEAAVVLIRAEAASIALYDPEQRRLVFRVAAGAQGQGVVGLAIEPDQGVAGYVYSSGEPLAIGETTVDPRFQREAAEQTGYVPRSLLAVPLADEAGTIGVLEVLDRRDGGPFDLMDLEAASIFARPATVALRATRLERDTARLFRAALAARATETAPAAEDATTEAQVEALVSSLSAELLATPADDGSEGGLWALVDAVARARAASPDQIALVTDILESLASRAAGPSTRFRGARR